MRWVEKIARPWLLGAAYLVLLAVRAAGAVDESAATLGAHASAINDFVRTRYSGEITRLGIAIAILAALIGAGLGAAAGVFVEARDRVEGRERSPLSVSIRALVLTVLLHAWFEAVAMASTPALYVDAFYARGGLARTVHVLVTDTLGAWGVMLIGGLALVLYLAGPRRTWNEWPARLRTIQREMRAIATRGTARAASGTLVALAIGALATFALPMPKRAAAAGASKPNVLVIAADSFRFDRLDAKTAPHLTALAERGARFDRAYVSLPRTFPSWVTLLTGRHPHHHGIRNMFPRWEDRAKDFDALPERLGKAGYRTAVISDYAGDIFGRIDLGFGEVDTPTFDMRELVRQRALERETPLLPFLDDRAGRAIFPVLRELADAADPELLAADALRAIDRTSGAPFFATVFFSTAHFPYAAPEPWAARFTNGKYRGRFKYDKPVGLGKDAPPDADDVEQIRGLYDGAIASIDDACGQLLAGLDRRGLLQNTIVVVTADHGESLYEGNHGSGHGDHLFGDEATHVPFVVVDPRKAPVKRVPTIVRDVDLAPTLYALTGVTPPADLDGRSLAAALDGQSLPDAFAYAETGLWFTQEIPAVPADLRLPYPTLEGITELDAAHGDEIVIEREMKNLTRVAKHRMIRDARWKLVYAPTRTGVKYMLFDTQQDPLETRDVAADHVAEVQRLKGELWRWMLEDRQMTESGGYLLPVEDDVVVSDAGVRVEPKP